MDLEMGLDIEDSPSASGSAVATSHTGSKSRKARKNKSQALVPRKRLPRNVTCSMCQMKFSFPSNLHRHMKNVHKKTEACQEENCTYLCGSKRQLLLHTEQEHRPDIEKEELIFQTIEDFYVWKLKEECQNFVCYTKRRGDIEMVSSHHEFYICYLNRRIATTSKLKKSRAALCPSRMLLKQNKKDGRVTLTYYKTHSHNLTYSSVQNLPMPDCLRHSIREKLSLGLSIREVETQLKREHQSQLAVSIAVYNRLQKFDRIQVSMIQRAMVRKGLLPYAVDDKGMQEMSVGKFGNETVVVIDGEIVNDGEVQMDIEPGQGLCEDLGHPRTMNQASNMTPMPIITQQYTPYQESNLPISISTEIESNADPMIEHVDTSILEEPVVSDEQLKQNDVEKGLQLSPKLREMFTQVILLLDNESVKEDNLKLVEKSVENLLDICKSSV